MEYLVILTCSVILVVLLLFSSRVRVRIRIRFSVMDGYWLHTQTHTHTHTHTHSTHTHRCVITAGFDLGKSRFVHWSQRIVICIRSKAINADGTKTRGQKQTEYHPLTIRTIYARLKHIQIRVGQSNPIWMFATYVQSIL